MTLSELILEHSNYRADPRYTAEVMEKLRLACRAVSDHARTMGIEFEFSRHFFDQIMLERGLRGANIIGPQDVMRASAKVLNRGLNFFQDKPEGTDFAFVDQSQDLILAVKKMAQDRYLVMTVVRDYRWAGRSQKILL